MAVPAKPSGKAPSKARILMLHGNGQSDETFRIKTRSLRRSLKRMMSMHTCTSRDETPDDIEFVYVDAPVTAAEIYSNSLPYDTAIEAPSALYPDDGSRVWAYGDPYEDIHGIDDSVQYILNIMHKQGPFDGVVGFSVGAAIAALVTRLFEKPDLLDGFVGSVQSTKISHPPLRFAVCFSGFQVPGPRFQHVYDSPIETPILHISGTWDTMISSVLTRQLADVCANGTYISFMGAHFVPQDEKITDYIAHFVLHTLQGSW